jgi:general secretion pathway protein E
LNAVQAQRLVRKLCRHCRQAYTPPEEVVQRWGLDKYSANGDTTLYRPGGCDHCSGTGYSGRSAILELLVMTDRIRQLILQRADAGMLAKAAAAEGMGSMFEDGLRKALAGDTSIDEVLRVTQDSRQ